MLIDEALAAGAAAAPGTLGGQIDIGPKQALVYAVYTAVQANRTGRGGSDTQVEGFVQSARRAGIDEDEINAAISAAERDSTSGG